MKTWIIPALLACTPLIAEEAPSAKKPPVGVPGDAKLFNGKWYRAYTGKRINWYEARTKCAALGGQLAIVPDEPTWRFLQKLAPGPILWLGATDEQTTGVWKWVDGSPVIFTAWNEGEPNNWQGIQHYMCLHGNGWDDIQKDGGAGGTIQVIGYICEWKEKR